MNRYYILITLVFVSFLGCNDAIDIRQPGRLDAESAFQNVADLEQGLLGLYAQLDATPEIALASNFTDEVSIGANSGGQGLQLYNFVITPQSAAGSNFWVRNFRINHRATVLLEAAALITPEPADLDAYNNVVGQAHAVRAMANLEMLTYFATDVRNDEGLGIPVIDFVAPLDIQPTRNTVGESWDYINSDLDAAESLIVDQSSVYTFSRDAVRALRARALAARGDYVNAGPIAQSLLNAYPLANRTQYQLLFLDADDTEVIFKLQRVLSDGYNGQGATGSVNAGGWAGAVYAFVDPTLTGGAFFEFDRSLFNLLDPDDIRFNVNVAPTSIIDPNYQSSPDPLATDRLIIQKYPGKDGRPLMNDLKIFRSSEMLLILAEARVAQGNLNGAAQLVKQLRDARFGSPQPLPNFGTPAVAYGGILDERRIEFCFEGHRYRDLKRLGTLANKGVERDPVDCELQGGACTLPANDFRFTLPIPLVELNATPGLRDQQNPGY